jgi:hypothetical protein
MTADMDRAAFQAAFAAKHTDPTLDHLVRRFKAAFQQTGGDTHSAMAAVNEVLATPITYEALMGRFRRAA